MTKTLAELHKAGYGRWKLPTATQCAAIRDYRRAQGQEIGLGAQSCQIALWEIRRSDPKFLTGEKA
jgi:hypothetical protein